MGRGKKRVEITSSPSKPSSLSPKKSKKSTPKDGDISFAGPPVPSDEAKSKWPHRYHSKNKTATILVTLSDGSTEEKEFFQARCHYMKALVVDGVEFNLFEDAYIQASEGEPDFIAKIVEMFETVSKETYICTQWFYRAKDTKWAVDFNSYACESLKSNHPNTEVRNEDAEDFFDLLKEWENLCKKPHNIDSDESEIEIGDDLAVPSGEFEVEKLVAICYGDPNNLKKRGLHFKVRWKGYGRADDTWEPIDGLRKCEERIKQFVSRGYRARILPLPGDVDFICGGPPCQGISGFNRFRYVCDPLEDKKNRQLVVFMNIVEFLKPRYVLMENVTDILKFAKGQLACYAVGRLVSMNYQARLGIMAAGAYGVPQCRMRFFLWGAGPMESLPQFPLPTHEVLKKGVVINEFKEIIIGHGNEHCELHRTVLLGDVISDLPEVTNDADQDELPYGRTARTVFQKFIRLKRHDIFGYADNKKNDSHKSALYDHRPLQLNQDDYERVCHIPKVKGANFRNLRGVMVGPDNVVKLDPSVERALCTSGKPLVPDYALKFEDGKSSKPFGRLGMDDIVATVVTRAEPHNQVILHPDQDRVLSVRENARLQGFPDCYKLYGPIKERYIQVGNAVSFSVSIPLGYCLAKAMQGASTATPLSIPFKFPDCLGEFEGC
ncbi:hypothetical protein Pfo_028166 [Paulownia fortunei]|nr:hypothetical protein Pfo_028166 [Paulownia fortunei]